MYILGSGALNSLNELTQPPLYTELLIRDRLGAPSASYSLDAVICESGMGIFPLTNASSTTQDGSNKYVNVVKIYLNVDTLNRKWFNICVLLRMVRTKIKTIFAEEQDIAIPYKHCGSFSHPDGRHSMTPLMLMV